MANLSKLEEILCSALEAQTEKLSVTCQIYIDEKENVELIIAIASLTISDVFIAS